MSAVPPITKDEMEAWSRHVHDLCGVHLDPSKGYLVEGRLGLLLKESGAGTWNMLLSRVRADATRTLARKVISAITTHETSFFRDTAPFELLRHKLLPELVDRRNKAGLRPVPIRILTAACSTGQEAYSIAMVLKETLGDLRGYDARILGVDISDASVAAASYAHFTREEMSRGLTPDRVARHFDVVGDRWKVRDELRALTTFRRANLLEPLQATTPFDVVFCRNVAIYFTEPDRLLLFKHVGRSLARDGALIIGSTESITGLCPEFEPRRYLRSVFYQQVHATPTTGTVTTPQRP